MKDDKQNKDVRTLMRYVSSDEFKKAEILFVLNYLPTWPIIVPNGQFRTN